MRCATLAIGIANRSTPIPSEHRVDSQRHTKREEDLTYCLLGIFDVSMPMIYGEGGYKAFSRLQEEIMKTTRDHSIVGP
ncbi:Vegetative incompatibility protein HET-E-1 [Madurella mycetomatis]|uniref:Vegetative incompatibility protein HET-E-1 n=1 Tax=Madurella mycetomatis TaxID=100816 RepID=A0A175WF73_9PEZI|nr:Vegetative incompatibility protein HET-E-1 [Madurella mycetomatis]